MVVVTGPFEISNIAVDAVSWTTHGPELKRLRTQVFIEEQGVPAREEWDELDGEAIHLLATELDSGRSIGTARLLPKGKLTRMAVAPEFRGRGVGRLLLKRAIQIATERGLLQLYLDAQVTAQGFYERQGFVAEGALFMDAGITHITMRRGLGITSEQAKSGDVLRFHQPSDARAIIRIYSQAARHSLDILSNKLPPLLYADLDLIESISALARKSPRSRVRILVKDTRPLNGTGHALVGLVQRLPSRISLRKIADEIPLTDIGFCCADNAHLVYFSSEENYSGFARYQARAESRQRLDEFEHWWHYASDPDPNLQTFRL